MKHVLFGTDYNLELPTPPNKILVAASFVQSVTIRLSRIMRCRPLTSIEQYSWPVVAEHAADLTGNPVQIAVAATADRDDLRSVVFKASRELSIISGGSNSQVSKLLAIANSPRPWQLSWNTPFWNRFVTVTRAADITILNSAVRVIQDGITKWKGDCKPHICVGRHVGIWLSPVD